MVCHVKVVSTVNYGSQFNTLPQYAFDMEKTGVVADTRILADEFEPGGILTRADTDLVELGTVVTRGTRAVFFFVVQEPGHERFEELVTAHPSVERVQQVSRQEGERLFTLDWDTSGDRLFEAVRTTDAQLLAVRQAAAGWQLVFRFPGHDALVQFRELCEGAGIGLVVERVCIPSSPDYGLTEPQREALVEAVRRGYYAIPRQLTTADLAEQFGISDQAVTERLRRAVRALTESTLLAVQTSDGETDES
jgi:hypothetical protein